MLKKPIFFLLALTFLFLSFACQPVLAQTSSDWYMAGANPQRTSWTSEQVMPRGPLPIWYKRIEPYIPNKVQLIAAYDTLYVSTARGLYALDASTGAEKWVYATELPLGHSPTIHNGRAYVGGYDHKIHAINAYTGQGIWTYEAKQDGIGAGFQTNPLVIEVDVDNNGSDETMIYAGNRDGYMYAIEDQGNQPSLRWSYKTGGPIAFSAAYKDNRIYFASNDAKAYALNAKNGSLIWNQFLPSPGFHSWWPVVYTDPDTNSDYVIYSGNVNYRSGLDPSPSRYDLQRLERVDLYINNGLFGDATIGTINSQTYLMDATRILEYYEQKPYRRTYFVLNATNGQEYRVSYQRPGGGTGTSYAPITWQGTHAAGNRYPPVVNPNDGLLYQPMNYKSNIDASTQNGIPKSQIVGWKPGMTSLKVPSQSTIPIEAMDEPIGYSMGGEIIYYNLCVDRRAGAYNTRTNSHSYLFDYNLQTNLPNYFDMYGWDGTNYRIRGRSWYQGNTGSFNGIYSATHGDVPSPIAYKGRVYSYHSNAIMAWGTSSGQGSRLSVAGPVDVDNANLTPTNKALLKQRLVDEIEKIIGPCRQNKNWSNCHLKPGHIGSGLFGWQSDNEGDYLLDYWHNPSDTIYALLLTLPHIDDASLRQDVRSYIQSEFNAYPPYRYIHTGYRDGAAREPYALPNDLVANMQNYGPTSCNYEYDYWDFPPHTFYVLWKYAEEFGGASSIFSSSQSKFPRTNSGPVCGAAAYYHYPTDQEFVAHSEVLNSYIAGHIGYLNLQQLATGSKSSTIQAELNRLMSLRTNQFSKDYHRGASVGMDRILNVARNFMYLVPEVADQLKSSKEVAVRAALEEYDHIAPYWFVSKIEEVESEGVIGPLFTPFAMYQAKALILNEPYEELIKYLDVPGAERGDLNYIQNLVAALEAPISGTQPTITSSPTPTPAPIPGDANGDRKVDGVDYVIWLNYYNTTTGSGASDGDFDGNGTVDGIDYVIWLNNYGS